MSLTLHPSSWSAPSVARADGVRPGGAQPVADEAGGLHWHLRRNCALTPAQFGAVFITLAAVSAAIAVFFFVAGAPFVAYFAGIEMLALGVAFVAFARHAGDAEHICLRDGRVQVEQHVGARVVRTEIEAAWARVESPVAGRSLVTLSGPGQHVQLGRHLVVAERARLAASLRQSLRQCAAVAPSSRPSEPPSGASSPISDSKQAA